MTLQWYLAELRAAAADHARGLKIAGLVALVWVAILIGKSNLLPHLEGALFPVLGGTSITRATQRADGVTVFYGRATKLRECAFRRVEWFWKLGEVDVPLPLYFLRSDGLRPIADFAFGPWGISLPKDRLLRESYGVVWHKCHPFGLTATRFYP